MTAEMWTIIGAATALAAAILPGQYAIWRTRHGTRTIGAADSAGYAEPWIAMAWKSRPMIGSPASSLFWMKMNPSSSRRASSRRKVLRVTLP